MLCNSIFCNCVKSNPYTCITVPRPPCTSAQGLTSQLSWTAVCICAILSSSVQSYMKSSANITVPRATLCRISHFGQCAIIFKYMQSCSILRSNRKSCLILCKPDDSFPVWVGQKAHDLGAGFGRCQENARKGSVLHFACCALHFALYTIAYRLFALVAALRNWAK